MDSTSHGRRHFHRGRQRQDRRGQDRRSSQQQDQSQRAERPARGERGENVDVEQIMRDIRARIAQRHGIELTEQQIQELAARRLESILDPRTVKPSLLDQLRKAAGDDKTAARRDTAQAPYEFSESIIYESHSALTRVFRKLLNPVLKLFFNPVPITRALSTQAALNLEFAKREAERDQRQTEWNALHYSILQRLVTEVARVSLEIQSLGLRVEALSSKVDFNERRVRGIEGSLHQPRLAPREQPAASAPSPAIAEAPPGEQAAGEIPPSEAAPRRRRRRRRGRRGAGTAEPTAAAAASAAAEALDAEDVEEGAAEEDAAEPVTTEGEAIVSTTSPPTATLAAAESEWEPEREAYSQEQHESHSEVEAHRPIETPSSAPAVAPVPDTEPGEQ